MAIASNDDKIIGGMGIAAFVIFLIMLCVAIVMGDFDFGSGAISDLFSETAFMAGCIIAGAIGLIFGLMITFRKSESKVFIARIRGILIILAAVSLIALGASKGNDIAVYLFVALIILAAVADIFYNWVTDQKILTVIVLLLTLCMALTGALSLTGDNNATAFAFIFFIVIWVCVIAMMRFAPVVEPAPTKKDKKKGAEAKKKNEPAPKPYPAKKAEPPKKAEKGVAEKIGRAHV